MSGKSVFFINNHTSLLGHRISIVSNRYPTFRFDLIDKVKMSICRLSMTSLNYTTLIIALFLLRGDRNFTHICPRVPIKNVAWIYDIFNANFANKNVLSK